MGPGEAALARAQARAQVLAGLRAAVVVKVVAGVDGPPQHGRPPRRGVVREWSSVAVGK